MDLMLDGKGTLANQLARALRVGITSGRITAGSRLPPTRELGYRLGLSRTTVVAAYDRLQVEGYISGKVGSGSYVQSLTTRKSVVRPASIDSQPRSTFSRRAGQLVDVANLPGRRPPGARYAFEFGLPIVNAKLSEQWSRVIKRVSPYAPHGYPQAQGLPALREAIAAHVSRTRGVMCGARDVLVVNGTQQAITVVSRAILDAGDPVAIEDPHYYAARIILQLQGASVHATRVDDEGICVDDLPKVNPKLILVTPSHQFPTGAVLSRERREALLNYAYANSAWILEDDYDGEFRTQQAPLPALQSLDKRGQVIYVGTFSKTLFPALRLAYVVAPPGLMRDLVAAKWADDFGTASLEQLALAEFINSGAYDRHLKHVTRTLDERRNLLRQLLSLECGDRVLTCNPKTGMHVVSWLAGVDRTGGDHLLRLAESRSLALCAISDYYINPPATFGLVMGFSAMARKQMIEAVKIFAACLMQLDAYSPRN